MAHRLIFTNTPKINTSLRQKFVVGSGVGSRNRSVYRALQKRASNNAYGLPCCISTTIVRPNISIGFETNINHSMTIRSNSGGSYTLDNTTIVNYSGNGNTDIVINAICQTIDFNDATITYFIIFNTNATTLTNINLPQLEVFFCANNQFTGTLPSFNACTLLQNFNCYNNQFDGTLPSFNTCTLLVYFSCHENQFTDTLPSFNTCTLLVYFSCHENQFTDTLPSFNACTQLEVFYCYNNQFDGTLPSFNACTLLQDFICRINQFTDTLPSFNACTKLVYFSCRENQFTDTLPSFNACTQLQRFYCYNNQFDGTLPSFNACTQLQRFNCYNNQFDGTLPSFNACTQLEVFYCDRNIYTLLDVTTFINTLPAANPPGSLIINTQYTIPPITTTLGIISVPSGGWTVT